MPIRRRFVVLANSHKNIPGRCLAGRLLEDNDRPGAWIRPVSNRPGGEVLSEHVLTPGGAAFDLLHVVRVPLDRHIASRTHPEDWLIAAGEPWRLERRLHPYELERFVEEPANLWLDASQPDDMVSSEALIGGGGHQTLYLIRPEGFAYELSTIAVAGSDRPRRQRLARFSYRDREYTFAVTDPAFLHRYQHTFPKLGEPAAVLQPQRSDGLLLCVSLTPAMEGVHQKLVAAVIED
ncbi:MAG: dual OB domain-containing protein [Phycisphaerae bacterium]